MKTRLLRTVMKFNKPDHMKQEHPPAPNPDLKCERALRLLHALDVPFFYSYFYVFPALTFDHTRSHRAKSLTHASAASLA